MKQATAITVEKINQLFNKCGAQAANGSKPFVTPFMLNHNGCDRFSVSLGQQVFPMDRKDEAIQYSYLSQVMDLIEEDGYSVEVENNTYNDYNVGGGYSFIKQLWYGLEISKKTQE